MLFHTRESVENLLKKMFLAIITVWSADVSDPGRAWKTC